MRTAGILVASSRAASGARPDRSAPLIADWLRTRRLEPVPPEIVPDGEQVRAGLLRLLARSPRLVLTTGGTGLTPDDVTPEQTRTVLEREIPGIAEAIRAAGRRHTPLADLSRGCAGVARGALVVNLPGSVAGIRDALTVLDPLLDHALEQIDGDHEH